jgi:hypothetical protein
LYCAKNMFPLGFTTSYTSGLFASGQYSDNT